MRPQGEFNPTHQKLSYILEVQNVAKVTEFLSTYSFWRFPMTAHQRARDLLARRRQQHENRRAAMLGRSGQEVARLRQQSGEWQ